MRYSAATRCAADALGRFTVRCEDCGWLGNWDKAETRTVKGDSWGSYYGPSPDESYAVCPSCGIEDGLFEGRWLKATRRVNNLHRKEVA